MARVVAVVLPRVQPYAEVRERIAAERAQSEGEKRARALCGKLRRGMRVTVNAAALAKLDDLAAQP